MPALQRNSSPRGPRFYEDGGELKFMQVFDANTIDGPREATDEDRLAHPQAYADYEARQAGVAGDESFPGVKPIVTFKGERPADLPKPQGRRAQADA
jgi:hypothetical protein